MPENTDSVQAQDAERAAPITSESFVDISHALVDTSRNTRCGRPEAVFCPGKTPAQVAEIALQLLDRNGYCLCTRAEPAHAAAVLEKSPRASYDASSRLIALGEAPCPAEKLRVGVVTAGTADQGVAVEAAGVLDFFQWEVVRISDVGVAGIHRLFAKLPELRACAVLVVIAGMEGALPTAVAGLVDCPIIAVPTSVGYGANFGGLSALLTMLNSCASGLTVTNIDNGYGAACAADAILRLASKQKN